MRLVCIVSDHSHVSICYFLKVLARDSVRMCIGPDIFFAVAIRSVFLETLKQMYGIKHNLTSLPVMPSSDGTWSVMHSWALPTKSFLEFVMFSRFQLFQNPVPIRFQQTNISFNKLLFCRFIESLWMHLMHNSTRITKRPSSAVLVYRRY